MTVFVQSTHNGKLNLIIQVGYTSRCMHIGLYMVRRLRNRYSISGSRNLSLTWSVQKCCGIHQPLMQWVRKDSLSNARTTRSWSSIHIYSAEVRNAWKYISFLPYTFMTLWLTTHRDKYIFTWHFEFTSRWEAKIVGLYKKNGTH